MKKMSGSQLTKSLSDRSTLAENSMRFRNKNEREQPKHVNSAGPASNPSRRKKGDMRGLGYKYAQKSVKLTYQHPAYCIPVDALTDRLLKLTVCA